MTNSRPAIALSWFRREDFARWREIDPNFEPSYPRWLAKTREMIEALEKQGIGVVLVPIAPDAFVAWAKEHGKSTRTEARGEFAAVLMMQRSRH
jgi:hypothetical protein